jgi:site-specific DNA recombinase
MRYFIYCRKSSEAEDRQVLSIESQLTTLRRTFSADSAIEIAGVYQESYSAKSPGRPIFNEMVSRIERGDAHGIVTWAPDRLARNSIDGGRIIYLLDQGVVRNLKFATYTFENNSQGKFMLQIMFGQSKYYSDALSENVKRGNRTKVEKGWRPNQAPLGYLNDPATKTIVQDPVHFPLIRKMFDLMLTGCYTPKQIAIIARDEWGFRTPKRKRIGGVPLAMSSVYHLLNNPFYAGILMWEGQAHAGKHEPVVTVDEFARVRQLLQRSAPRRPQRHEFAFTGLIRCGSCGLGITAEHKVNRFGSRYTYYHCSKRALGPRCPEPSVELRDLESQIEAFLRSLAIPPSIERWVYEEMQNVSLSEQKVEDARQSSLGKATTEIGDQLEELTGLRLRGLMDDEEFVRRRTRLQMERLRLQERLTVDNKGNEWFEPLCEVISFSNRAADWFAAGDQRAKRAIFETVCSNPTLTGKILNIEAAKPFSIPAQSTNCPSQLGVLEEVRTQTPQEEWDRIVANIRMIKARFEPESLAKRTHGRRRARGA